MEIASRALRSPPSSAPLLRPTHRADASPVSHRPILPVRTAYAGVSFTVSHRRLRPFQIRAVGDMTVLPSDCAEDVSLNSSEPENLKVHDDKCPPDDVGIEANGNDQECLDDKRMLRVCDKLIGVFMVDKPTTTDWRRLLAFSTEWSNIGPHFYKRCQERADAESDPGMKHKLLRLSRKLKEIDDDVQRHNELLQVIKNDPSNVDAIVARRRKDFTKEFFVHLHTVTESYYDKPAEQNDTRGFSILSRMELSTHFVILSLAHIGNTCLAAVQAYDTASESIEALNAAELKFQDIINSPSVDAACRKIDDLAEKKQLDSTMMLMITKAWSAAKESNLMKDEVKDILFHLYKTAVGNLQRLMPKEIRILKYLLTIEDPEEQLCALKDAFTPGAELEGKDVDCLHTTPELLYTWISTVVDAYHFSREGTLIREARDLMNPKVIQRLENLKILVKNNFL